jgi:Outer membrane protein beta-barrel domain
MKMFRNSFLLLAALCFGITAANAQSGLDVYFGAGTMSADSSGKSIDTFGTGQSFPANTAGLYNTPRLGGLFGKAGADFMFTPHFGVGGEADFRFTQGAYAGLTYRPTFYDFYGIYQPTTRFKRVVPVLIGGLGAANLKFYDSQSFCNAFTGCSSSSNSLDSSNHFQVRVGAGLALYATPHIFVRPQVDAHYVNNFFQFGSNWVPEYSVSVGYRFGEH